MAVDLIKVMVDLGEEVVETTAKLPKLIVSFSRKLLIWKKIVGSRESPMS